MGWKVRSKKVLIDPSKKECLYELNLEQLIQVIEAYQLKLKQAVQVNKDLAEENEDLRNQLGIKGSQILTLNEKVVLIQHELFGVSSERRKKEILAGEKTQKLGPKIQMPSLRYQALDLVESRFDFKEAPSCPCCSHGMEKMNQVEQSEEVDLIPKKFFVRRILREKYRCSYCHGSILTAPGPGKLVEGGSYSIPFALDVAEQKYLHHLPIERIKKQYQNLGLQEIEGPTLIEQTHHVADRMRKVARAIRGEILESSVLHADETTWRMLEGHPKRSWFLWCFGSAAGIYYRPAVDRSGDNAERFLKEARSKFLMVDGYSGYSSAKREVNSSIQLVHCWAHVRRKLIDAERVDHRATQAIQWIDELFKIDRYAQSYEDRQTARETRGRPVIHKIREWANQQTYLPSSTLGKAIEYMVKYWEGLILFLDYPEVPLDNNFAERAMRGAVLGRKNFYGNHSPRGADTSAVLYTIIETCKLLKINPHKYMHYVITTENENKLPMTPLQYSRQ